jgi:hypothetical protein
VPLVSAFGKKQGEAGIRETGLQSRLFEKRSCAAGSTQFHPRRAITTGTRRLSPVMLNSVPNVARNPLASSICTLSRTTTLSGSVFRSKDFVKLVEQIGIDGRIRIER